ncbi:hypothetical protein [Phenylobacterium sp.]|uniref:hypothetical protein n=1 Tax=Phenylobacterium sp. TaxID=1871053 RepID=UPI002C5E3163|nr:hypothetical protein [Phenylobacterium sp.]HVI32978.1 hypothetical protein [Phenylobacterium sp.]
MREAEDKLAALFALDEPPPRDAAFSAEVMEAVIRREFQRDVALLTGASVVGAVALWAAWPVLQPAIVAVSQGLAPVAAGLAVAACAILLLSGRPSEPVEVES